MTPEEHFLHLAEFVKGVELAGGTTPHVSMTVAMMNRLEDPLEKLWFAGCYVLSYNWPTAELIWQWFRPYGFNAEDFLAWCTAEKVGIPIRKERKAVYGRAAFTECAATYAQLARALERNDRWPTTYAEAYDLFTGSVKYAGRYIAIRWLEVMRRAFPERCSGWSMTDLRADGGEHPRKAMALLYPQWGAELLGGNTRREIHVTDAVGEMLKTDLELSFGVQTNYYELQSLLCEYKQAFLGRKHYPGKSIDTEVGYFDKLAAHWGADRESEFWSVREECFSDWSLGERQGWRGVRRELLPLIADYGIVWSDLVYDYKSTTDFSAPELRPGGRERILL